jgi:hypothetical protein
MYCSDSTGTVPLEKMILELSKSISEVSRMGGRKVLV